MCTLRAWQAKVPSLFCCAGALKRGTGQEGLQFKQRLTLNDGRRHHLQRQARRRVEHPLRHFEAARARSLVVATAHHDMARPVHNLVNRN
jgi:hypothetical protein